MKTYGDSFNHNLANITANAEWCISVILWSYINEFHSMMIIENIMMMGVIMMELDMQRTYVALQ